ncbi:hypothetical protein HCA55_03485 [Listeria booriae]|uniref:Uncharacterized protein n=1 Tax=Listeria booriae TaxID=1552123 RepID=A0A7X0XYT9_9LIST|nr:hypothetical protein [Listeria booriae]MBC1794176.1 hypothetical protein [Listeria booriae]MBC1795770.1 hypothetical protein [Listeria booriae]MBC1800085.1 hypothetical protein [Listeria booriae]MBC1804495.1 hypothetical protein [Listeria booriae]MBC1813589.1 hypothetical protein [Listeria booriae]
MTVTSNDASVITGEAKTTLSLGASFDPMSPMKAVDKEDGDATSNVIITSNDVDTIVP